MTFSKLKASILNNAEEEASIYMAICMIESLFEDIEQETGTELFDLPIGDETLPTKLVWLCRNVEAIYKAKQGEFTRNVKRLDSSIHSLKEKVAELEGFARGKEQEDALLSQIRDAETAHKKKREALQESEKQLENLQEEARKLAERDRELREGMEGISSSITDKKQEILKLEESQEEAVREKSRILEKHKAAKESYEKLKGEIAALAREEALLEKEYEAAKEERDKKLKEKNDIIKQKEAVIEEIARLKNERENIEGSTEERERDIALAKEKIGRASEKEEAAKQELARLLTLLEELQGQVSRLEDESIPQKKEYIEQEGRRKESLQKELGDLTQKSAELSHSIEDLQKSYAEKKERHGTLQSQYISMTEDLAKTDKQICELESNIAKLEESTDIRQYDVYKAQLHEKAAELQKKEAEGKKYSEEVSRLKKRISHEEVRAKDLERTMGEMRDKEEKLNLYVNELKTVVTPEYIEELHELSGRLELILSVREGLQNTIQKLQSNIAYVQPEPMARIQNIVFLSDSLRKQVDALKDQILACANTIHLEAV